MSEKIGYIQRRSRTLTPEQQTEELKAFGVNVIYDRWEDIINPATLREGDTLVVWSIGIIGRVNIPKIFLSVAEAKGAGIYSLKVKKLYPAELGASQTLHDVYNEMASYENKVRSEATKGKSGRARKAAWDKSDQIRTLANDGVHIDDLALQFKASPATIRRILQ